MSGVAVRTSSRRVEVADEIPMALTWIEHAAGSSTEVDTEVVSASPEVSPEVEADPGSMCMKLR